MANKDDVHGIKRGRGESEIEGLRTHNIIVQVYPDADDVTIDQIPDNVNGVPVEISYEEPPTEVGCSDHYNSQPDPMKGGLRMDSSSSCGTLCTRVRNYDSDSGEWVKYMLGARHVFASSICDTSSVEGDSWYQYDDTEVGEVEIGWQGLDAVLLNRNATDRNWSTHIINEGKSIDGRVTKDGLDYIKSNHLDVEQRGISTGHGSGEIASTDAGNYYCSGSSVEDLVETEINSDGGDSGGPIYYPDNTGGGGDLFLVGMTILSSNTGTLGSSAHYMNSEENLWFGGEPNDG